MASGMSAVRAPMSASASPASPGRRRTREKAGRHGRDCRRLDAQRNHRYARADVQLRRRPRDGQVSGVAGGARHGEAVGDGVAPAVPVVSGSSLRSTSTSRRGSRSTHIEAACVRPSGIRRLRGCSPDRMHLTLQFHRLRPTPHSRRTCAAALDRSDRRWRRSIWRCAASACFRRAERRACCGLGSTPVASSCATLQRSAHHPRRRRADPEPHKRSFIPHLTLGALERSRTARESRRLSRLSEPSAGDGADRSCYFLRSRLSPAGPTYIPLAEALRLHARLKPRTTICPLTSSSPLRSGTCIGSIPFALPARAPLARHRSAAGRQRQRRRRQSCFATSGVDRSACS